MELYIKEIDGNKGRLFFDRQCKRPCLNLDTKIDIEFPDRPDLSDSIHFDEGITLDDCFIFNYGKSVYYYGELLPEVEKIANEKIHNYLNEVINELTVATSTSKNTIKSDFNLQLNMSYDEFEDLPHNIRCNCAYEYTDDTEENVIVTFNAGEFCMDYLEHQSCIDNYNFHSILVDNKGNIKTIDDREYFLNTTQIIKIYADMRVIENDNTDIFVVVYYLFFNIIVDFSYTLDIDVIDIFTMEENSAFSLYDSNRTKCATITLVDSDTPTFMLSLPGGLSGKFSTLSEFRELVYDTDLYDYFFY